MKKNIFGYILFILGHVFLIIGLSKFPNYDNDTDLGVCLIFLLIAIVQIVFGVKLSLNKNND